MVHITYEEFSGKRMMPSEMFSWLDEHEITAKRWIDENISYKSRGEFMERMINSPMFPYMIIRDSLMSEGEKKSMLLNKLTETRGRIDIVTGAKRSGKTCFVFDLLSSLSQAGEKVHWFGPPCRLPRFFRGSTLNFDKIPPNTTTFVDEASVQYFNRCSSENVDIIRKLPVISHSGRNFVYATQSTSIQDVNILKLATSIIFKSASVVSTETERLRISEDIAQFLPIKQSEYLYYDNHGIIFGEFDKPHWWKEEYSTPYAPFPNKAEAYRFMLKLIAEGHAPEEISTQLSLKGFSLPPEDIDIISGSIRSATACAQMNNQDLISFIDAGFDDSTLEESLESRPTNIRPDFEMSPLMESNKREELAENLPLAKADRKKISWLFIEDLKKRSDPRSPNNVIISIWGPTGSGKSWSALYIAYFISGLTGGKVYTGFSVDEILGLLKKTRPGDVILMDEQVDTFGPGSGSEAARLRNAEETMRKAGVSFIYCSPEARSHQHHFVLRTWGICPSRGRSKLLVSDASSKRHLGYIITGKPPKDVVNEYEKRKDDFLKKVKAGNSMTKSPNEYAKELAAKYDLSKTSKGEIRALVREEFGNMPVYLTDEIASAAKMFSKNKDLIKG